MNPASIPPLKRAGSSGLFRYLTSAEMKPAAPMSAWDWNTAA